MNKQIVYFTDLDGTLLTDDKKILDTDIDAIKKFKDVGGKFAIATGRTISGSKQYFDILKPNFPCVFYNGSVVYNIEKDEILYQNSLPDIAIEVTKEIMDKFPDAMTEILRVQEIYVLNINKRGQEQLDICQENPVICPFENIDKYNWLKVLFAAEKEVIDKIIDYVYEKNITGVNFARSGEPYFEMLPLGSSKGTAIEHLLSETSYKKDILVTAGDYDNDIEMLKLGDISWTPSNAQDITKKYAKIISDKDNNTGATGKIISDIINNLI